MRLDKVGANMLDVKKIVFDNYKCFNNSVELGALKPINIIIGKNNIGKSSILDIIEMMYNPKMHLENRATCIYAEKELSESVIASVFPRSTTGGIIGGNFYQFGQRFIGEMFRFKIGAMRSFNNTYVIKTESPDNIEQVNEIYEKKYAEMWDKVGARIDFNNKIVTKRIYAERNLVPEENKNDFCMDGYGNGGTNSINSYLNKSKYDENIVKVEMLNKLNEIMGEDAQFQDITTQQVEENERWEIFLKERGKERVALSKSGSGLKTILLVLIYTMLVPKIEKREISDYIFLFEELENNLHPSLERRLLKYIEEIAKNGTTIFLTTHSSTVLNGFQNSELVQLYHVGKEENEVVVKNLQDYYGKCGCIEDLGVKASDILQSNGIIWVEGPSDRIYINKWIALWSGGTLKEGLDYQCVFYGGRLLSNVSFDENETNDLVKLININRNSIILIDSDKTSKSKKINQTKTRIKNEVEKCGNLCWITKGKEIENYIPKELIEEIYNKKVKYDFNQYDKINDYIDKNIRKGEGDKFLRYKIEFAKKTSELMNRENMGNVLDLDTNMKKIIERIRQWNNK